jgi:hypothetical protein
VAVYAITAAIALPVVGWATLVDAAPGGNSANAHACQKGGWQTLQTATGDSFTNQGACVSYGAHGGIPFSPSVTLTLSCDTDLHSLVITVAAFGFHPNILGGSETLIHDGHPQVSTNQVLLDANGNANPADQVIVTVNHDASALVTSKFADAAGVHASATPLRNVDLGQCAA